MNVTGVQTCALPICSPVGIGEPSINVSLLRSLGLCCGRRCYRQGAPNGASKPVHGSQCVFMGRWRFFVNVPRRTLLRLVSDTAAVREKERARMGPYRAAQPMSLLRRRAAFGHGAIEAALIALRIGIDVVNRAVYNLIGASRGPINQISG